MEITLSVIEADIGSVGGHLRPSEAVLAEVKGHVEAHRELFIDYYIGYTGDDISILFSHRRG